MRPVPSSNCGTTRPIALGFTRLELLSLAQDLEREPRPVLDLISVRTRDIGNCAMAVAGRPAGAQS